MKNLKIKFEFENFGLAEKKEWLFVLTPALAFSKEETALGSKTYEYSIGIGWIFWGIAISVSRKSENKA